MQLVRYYHDYPDYTLVPRRPTAKCVYGCGTTANLADHPTTEYLAFFESAYSKQKNCAKCGYYEEPHNDPDSRIFHNNTPHDFVPSDPAEHDSFYCGCKGWD